MSNEENPSARIALLKSSNDQLLGLVVGVNSAVVEKNWGERYFGLDSLKSVLNRDMEEKGIELRELNCQTVAELRPVRSGGRTPGAEPPPKLRRQFSSRSTTAGAVGLSKFRRQSGGGGSSAAVLKLRRRKGLYSQS
ncbi:unnamed protein product [Boreogadus saida]